MYKFNLKFTKDFLIEEYLNKNKSNTDISRDCGCHAANVIYYLKKFNIKKDKSLIHRGKRKLNIKKDFLIEEYIIKNKTIKEISLETGYGYVTIEKYLNEHNIKKDIEKINKGKVHIGKNNCNYKYDISYNLLYNNYIIEDKSQKGIALEIGCSERLIQFNLNKYGIKKDKKVYYKKHSDNMKGKGNPRYLDDRSLLKTPLHLQDRQTYEYKEWRNKVYQRDNYCCKMCGKRSDGDLTAHHIKLYSVYESLRFDVDNGITLCEDCHLLVSWHEKDYETLFQSFVSFLKNGVKF